MTSWFLTFHNLIKIRKSTPFPKFQTGAIEAKPAQAGFVYVAVALVARLFEMLLLPDPFFVVRAVGSLTAAITPFPKPVVLATIWTNCL